MRKITVLLDYKQLGWDGSADSIDGVEQCAVTEAGLAFNWRYASDASWFPYYIEGAASIPRLRKRALPHLAALGLDLRFRLLALDIDHQPHDVAPSDAWRKEIDDALAAYPHAESVALYHTRGGCRLLAWLPEAVDAKTYELRCLEWRLHMMKHGIEAERIANWALSYRLWKVRRDDVDLDLPGTRMEDIETLPDIDPAVFALASDGEEHPLAKVLESKAPFRLPDTIPSGERNATLFKYAGKLHAQGCPVDEIERMLLEADRKRCKPPYQDEADGAVKIGEMALRIVNYEGGNKPDEKPAKGETENEKEEEVEPDLFFNHGSQVEYARWLRGGYVSDELDLVYDQGDLRSYDETQGLWVPLEMQEVRKAVAKLDRARVCTGFYKDGTPKISPLLVNHALMREVSRVLCDLQAEPGRFASVTPGLLFDNGFVSVDETGELSVRAACREDNATHAVDFEFDDKATTPLFDNFLHEVMEGTDREEKIRFAWEFIGCALLRAATRMQKAVFIVGGGANGKSTLIDILISLFPTGSVTSIAPQDFASEYRLAFLRSALLNAVNEAPDSEIAASATFKSTITGDLMMARQIREAPFAFRPIAAHAFLGNELPAFRDLSEGFARRWIVLTMDREFSVQEQDRTIGKRIREQENEAIVCRAIIAGATAIKRGHFIEPTTSVTARRRWRVENDQVAVFVEERIRPVEEAKHGALPMGIYRAYKAWAAASGHHPVSSVKFGKRMKALGFPQRRSNGKRIYMCRLEQPEG